MACLGGGLFSPSGSSMVYKFYLKPVLTETRIKS